MLFSQQFATISPKGFRFMRIAQVTLGTLPPLPLLRHLEVAEADVGNAGLLALEGTPALQRLSLADCQQASISRSDKTGRECASRGPSWSCRSGSPSRCQLANSRCCCQKRLLLRFRVASLRGS